MKKRRIIPIAISALAIPFGAAFAQQQEKNFEQLQGDFQQLNKEFQTLEQLDPQSQM